MKEKQGKLLKNVMGVAVAGIIFIFLGISLFRDWHKLSAYDWSFNFYYLLLSFFIFALSQVMLALTWRLIIKKLHAQLNLKKSMYIWFISQIARYIPGKIWFVLGRVHLCSKEGIPRIKSLLSMVLETGLIVTSGLLVALLSLFFLDVRIVTVYAPVFLIIPLGLFLLRPQILEKIINVILKMLKKPALKLGLQYGDILSLLSVYLFLWFVFGIAFYFLVRSLYFIPINQFFIFLGVYTISWIVGFLFFIMPAGLGVREGILVFLLSFYLPLSISIMVSLLSRIVMTVAELMITSIVWACRPES